MPRTTEVGIMRCVWCETTRGSFVALDRQIPRMPMCADIHACSDRMEKQGLMRRDSITTEMTADFRTFWELAGAQ